ncbi:MAG TPA: hypothetical protein VFY17_08105 [Pilimelia sp.]|nr:hypothetical protein [Pilimelia sp.]
MRHRPERLVTARAYALFTSALATDSSPSRGQAAAAVRHQLHRCGGARGCLAEVAYAYGDHPDTAAVRMRWARSLAARTCRRARRNR